MVLYSLYSRYCTVYNTLHLCTYIRFMLGSIVFSVLPVLLGMAVHAPEAYTFLFEDEEENKDIVMWQVCTQSQHLYIKYTIILDIQNISLLETRHFNNFKGSMVYFYSTVLNVSIQFLYNLFQGYPYSILFQGRLTLYILFQRYPNSTLYCFRGIPTLYCFRGIPTLFSGTPSSS